MAKAILDSMSCLAVLPRLHFKELDAKALFVHAHRFQLDQDGLGDVVEPLAL